MRLDRFIAKSRIIELQNPDFKGALTELLETLPLKEKVPREPKQLLNALLARENTMTSYLGNGVALPHLKIDTMKGRYLIAIGRCMDGLEYNGKQEYKDIRLVFLLIAGTKEQSYLNFLGELARLFRDPSTIDRLLEAYDLDAFKEQIISVFGRAGTSTENKQSKFNKLIQEEASKVAKGCTAVLIFGDAFTERVSLSPLLAKFKTILVTNRSTDYVIDRKNIDEVISVRSFSHTRLAQLRSAVLIGLTRGIFKKNDLLCCIAGLPESDQLDSLVVVDVGKEFQSLVVEQSDVLPAKVRPDVVERVLAIATELALEGREHRPVGCFFVLGDSTQVKKYTKPLVLNPFFGYKEEDRNILNPFMDETVKEFSTIDGAFIIQGNGILESAGTLIHVPDYTHELPSGLGSRHAAAAAISQVTECLAIVVSASTGQVTLFRRGEILPLLETGMYRSI